MPHRKNIRFATTAPNYYKPCDFPEPQKVPQSGDRVKETVTAILGAAFLWLYVFQAVYRVIRSFAEAQLFLVKSCRLIVLRIVADCRLLLDSLMDILWYIVDVRIVLVELYSYCLHLPAELTHTVRNITLRPLDLLVACTSPLRQWLLVWVLVLECCWRAARRALHFLLHCADSLLTIYSIQWQVTWHFLRAGVRAVMAVENIVVYTIMSYVCMAQVALRLLMDGLTVASYIVLGVARILGRLARWLRQDLERGVQSVILEFLATVWQVVRTAGLLAVYTVVICVRLVQVIGSWSLALCWGAPWTFQPTTKKSYSLQSKPFQTTGEYLVDLVLSLAH